MKIVTHILFLLASLHICAVLIDCCTLNGIGIILSECADEGASDTEVYENVEDESEEDTANVSEDLDDIHRLSAYVQFMNKPTNPYYLEITSPPPE